MIAVVVAGEILGWTLLDEFDLVAVENQGSPSAALGSKVADTAEDDTWVAYPAAWAAAHCFDMDAYLKL